MRNGTFAGYVGRDAELTYTPSGQPVCKFSIAVNRGKKDGEDLKALWTNCVIWGVRGEKLAPHIKKGTFAIVAGEMDVREYTDKSGEKRWSLEVNVQSFTFGSSKSDSISAPQQTRSGS